MCALFGQTKISKKDRAAVRMYSRSVFDAELSWCGIVKRTQLLHALAGKAAALLQDCVEVPRSLPSPSEEHDAAAAHAVTAAHD